MAKAFDLDKLANLLREAAMSEILPRFRRLDAGMVRQKTSAVDLVTEADEAAERFIAEGVRSALPGALFLGEEMVAADPSNLDALKGAELAVVVDPIDGTANYAAGLPLFGVMAGVVANGETVAGVIYDPMGDDWVIAEKGSGAWFRRPEGGSQRLHAASAVPLEDLVGTASIHQLPEELRARVGANLAKVRVAAAYRCAAHEYRLLATGHTHFAMFVKLMPWDHLAGSLIVAEAGSYLARFDGSAYRPEHTEGGLIVAPDRETWQVLRHEVFTV
jgi:fructose-1,6-bisphosphatase/inositol monophosphatase family enzyme